MARAPRRPADSQRGRTRAAAVRAPESTGAATLDAADRALLAEAIKARECAHAPWSHFRVGAAARFGRRIVHGCNVEFAVYGLTNCAERTAVFAAHACGAARAALSAIAVVADTPEPVSPCGACRQVMFECGGPNLRVILANLRGDVRVLRIDELLPNGFRLDSEMALASAARRSAADAARSRRKPR